MNCIIPDKISAGLTFTSLATLTAYPATDWALSVALRGPAVVNLTATAEGTQHRLNATATATALYVPGLYAYSVRVTDGTDIIEVENGTVVVLPDLAQSTGGDMRSEAKIILDNITAVITKRATQDQEKYRINNRELWRTPMADLLLLRNQYAAIVRSEDAKARGFSGFGQNVNMRLP